MRYVPRGKQRLGASGVYVVASAKNTQELNARARLVAYHLAPNAIVICSAEPSYAGPGSRRDILIAIGGGNLITWFAESEIVFFVIPFLVIGSAAALGGNAGSDLLRVNLWLSNANLIIRQAIAQRSQLVFRGEEIGVTPCVICAHADKHLAGLCSCNGGQECTFEIHAHRLSDIVNKAGVKSRKK